MELFEARMAAELSVVAYCDEEQAATIASDDFGLSSRLYSHHGTQAYLFADDDRAIVAFRGTQPNELFDIVADLKVSKIPGPWGLVHSGFSDALEYIWPTMLAYLLETHAGKKWYLTGHSLGAALSVLATAQLVRQNHDPAALITFGCPRVGNYEFARTFEEEFHNHWRYVNSSDVVTRVPRWRYFHCGWLRYFDVDGELHKNPSKRLQLWDRLTSYWRDRKAAVKNHSMQKYLVKVKGSSGYAS